MSFRSTYVFKYTRIRRFIFFLHFPGRLCEMVTLFHNIVTKKQFIPKNQNPLSKNSTELRSKNFRKWVKSKVIFVTHHSSETVCQILIKICWLITLAREKPCFIMISDKIYIAMTYLTICINIIIVIILNLAIVYTHLFMEHT